MPPDIEYRADARASTSTTSTCPSAACCSSSRRKRHRPLRPFARRPGSLRRLSHPQRLRPLRLRLRPRRHPAVPARFPRLPVQRPAARRPPVRQPRQQPLPVQSRGVLAAREGHQLRPQRRHPAARATTGSFIANLSTARISRSSASPARRASTYNINRERGDIEVDDNGFPVAPGADRQPARRATTTSSISATTPTGGSAGST